MQQLPIRIRNIFLREPQFFRPMRAHVHQATQWYHCLRGGLSVAIDGHVHSLRSGDSVLVPPRAQRETFRSGDPPCYFVAIFEDHQLDLAPIHLRLLTAPEELRSDLEALARELAGRTRPDSALLCQALLVRILLGLRRAALEEGERQPAHPDRHARRRLVRQVEAYLQRHLSEAPGREQIAAAVNVSGPHLAGIFKAETGRTLHERRSELAMSQAAFLLRDSDLSIGQIAQQVGYRSQSHFTKAFRKAYGRSPLRYRSG